MKTGYRQSPLVIILSMPKSDPGDGPFWTKESDYFATQHCVGLDPVRKHALVTVPIALRNQEQRAAT
jgi:hypothetical protein